MTLAELQPMMIPEAYQKLKENLDELKAREYEWGSFGSIVEY